MGQGLDMCVCPACGHQGLLVNTEDWKPVKIKCLRLKCGWSVNLRKFWGNPLFTFINDELTTWYFFNVTRRNSTMKEITIDTFKALGQEEVS